MAFETTSCVAVAFPSTGKHSHCHVQRLTTIRTPRDRYEVVEDDEGVARLVRKASLPPLQASNWPDYAAAAAKLEAERGSDPIAASNKRAALEQHCIGMAKMAEEGPALAAVGEYVLGALTDKHGMEEHFVPDAEAPAKSSVFLSPGWEQAATLVVVLQNQVGSRPGLWSRSLALSHGIGQASALDAVTMALGKVRARSRAAFAPPPAPPPLPP